MCLEKDIKKTIEYGAKFGSWLNKTEIEQRLISKKIYTKKEIYQQISGLKQKNKHNKWYKQKLNKAKEIAGKIESNFRDIMFLGVSGSVASGHPKKADDIDFLVITKKNKLWQNRLKLRWWIFKNKIPHRKYGKTEKENEFCFNLWLDEAYLKLPKDKQNLKNAVDLVLLKPIINKNKIYEEFLLTNNWAKKWVATPYENKISNFQFLISNEKQKTNKLEKIINCLYFWPQYWHMKRKLTRETVGLHQAFFHPQMVK